MSVRTVAVRSSRVRRTAAATGWLVAFGVLAGCTPVNGETRADSDPAPSASATTPERPTVVLTTNLPHKGTAVAVDQVVTVSAANGTLSEVALSSAEGEVAGELSAGDTVWTATGRLEPGAAYQLRTVAEDADGEPVSSTRSFRTQALTLDQQTYPSVAPLRGETVGVGMPVIVTFDVPVSDKATIEEHLTVESRPAQVGSWRWLSDTEVHWRPRKYWEPGTDVTVHADINSIPAGNGVYGQLSRTTKFHVGDALLMKIDVADHHMRVLRNGKLLRTIPISAGKPGFTTRSGVKVIIEKFRTKTMNAATTGIDENDPEYYNIEDVEYAQRVTYSGEFLHAAPWSVGSQGSANVSHGCVGMSTSDAAWLYGLTKRGDVVDVTGTDRRMDLTNGYGDWNLTFKEYQKGSALS